MPIQNKIRIIAGKWRGRKITFFPFSELRPTSDRIRETLFNWLAPHIQGATCLDLFAGSGALSFEAMSRMADSVVALETNTNVASTIQKNADILNVQNLTLLKKDAITYLQKKVNTFDIVFLDPPYASDYLSRCLNLLIENHWLNEGALIYFEFDPDLTKEFILPQSLTLLRKKKAGKVCYGLAQYQNQPKQ